MKIHRIVAVALCAVALLLAAGAPLQAQQPPRTSPVYYGNAGPYLATYPDTISCGVAQPCSSPSPVATATTIPVVQPVATQRIFLFWAGYYATGTNTSSTGQYVLTGTGCSGVLGAGQTFGLATPAGQVSFFYGGSAPSSTVAQIAPAPVPWVLPLGCGLNFVTVGTTIAGFPLALYAQHP